MMNIERIIGGIQIIGGGACRIAEKILVMLVFILIFAFSYFFLNHLIIVPYYENHPNYVLFYYITGVFILYNLIYNYVLCNRVGPGCPSDLNENVQNFKQLIKKRCKKCGVEKPIRTHHCSICQKCVLQMDHHCPWMGTCIGHYNRQYFVNFLTYLILISFMYVHMMQKFRMFHGDVYYFMFTICVVISFFALFHWILVLRGRTTLQICEIYDGYKPSRSIFHNFKIVYGTTNIIVALLPISRKLSIKGYEWKIDEDLETQNLNSQAEQFNMSEQIQI